MVENMKGKLLLKEYQLTLYRTMQNLRQSLLTLREYTKIFYKVNLREGYVEDAPENIARYIDGLRMDIEDEINMLSPKIV